MTHGHGIPYIFASEIIATNSFAINEPYVVKSSWWNQTSFVGLWYLLAKLNKSGDSIQGKYQRLNFTFGCHELVY